jgi:hypothetical protein
LITGKVAIKCAALLKGTGSFLRSRRLITKCIGRNVSRNNPANAITNFLEIEENSILSIVHEMFIGQLVKNKMLIIKIAVFNQKYNLY